jgi:thiol-disulfide isomerase/thioredoxin
VSTSIIRLAAVAPSSMTDLAIGEVANFTASDGLKPVPDIEFRTLDDAPISLEAFRGKVLVVNFWATWCAPCKRELPSLDRLQSQVGTDDLAVLAISIDRRGADKVTPYLEQVDLPHLAVYLDQKNKLGRAFGAFGLPTTYVIDQRGREVGRLIGPAEWDSDESVALVRHVIENG